MLQVLGKGGRPSSAISRQVTTRFPNDRIGGILPLAGDDHGRRLGPILIRLCGGLRAQGVPTLHS